MNPFPLPNIPTDNLYKFYSITGLVLIIFAISAMLVSLSNVSNKSHDLKVEIKIAELETFLLKQVIDSSKIAIIGSKKYNYSDLSINLDSMHYQNDELSRPSNVLKNLNNLIEELDIKILRLELNKEKVESEIKELTNIFYVFVFLLFLGSMLMAYGFGKWKTNVQDLIDERAMIELELLKLQLSEKKKISTNEKD